jgi:hypothetical protein
MKLYGKYEKTELEDLIFDKKKSYRDIGKLYGVSDTYIKKICSKLGIVLSKRSHFPENWVPHNKGKVKEKNCLNCNSLFGYTYDESKYCSKKCESSHRSKSKYDHYLNNQEEYCKISSMSFIKKHILSEQENCCNICKIKNEWNDKPIIFVLDHIDGDASNNKRENLRLVCPNCDSQLPTFKRKNKNSSRKNRYYLNYKNNI